MCKLDYKKKNSENHKMSYQMLLATHLEENIPIKIRCYLYAIQYTVTNILLANLSFNVQSCFVINILDKCSQRVLMF